MYKVHYLDENEQIGNMDVPFYIPHDDERARFGLPSSARVFHAIKKHDFKEENEIRSIIYKNSQEAGLQIPFNFKGFVSRVVLNPKSNDQQKEAIIELLNRYSSAITHHSIQSINTPSNPSSTPLITPTLRSASGQGERPGSRTLRGSNTTR